MFHRQSFFNQERVLKHRYCVSSLVGGDTMKPNARCKVIFIITVSSRIFVIFFKELFNEILCNAAVKNETGLNTYHKKLFVINDVFF